MGKDYEYDRNPASTHKPITREDLEFLLNNGLKTLKDEKNSQHLLTRMLATIKESKKRISDLQLQQEKDRLVENANDHPVTKALEVISQLTDEQKIQVLDAGYLTEMAKLRSAQESADRTRIAAISLNNRNRLDLSKVVDDPSLPENLREVINQILKRD